MNENARVLATVDALRHDDREALGALFAESHRSLAEDYEVSTPELDMLVAEATAAGAIACRMTGAGFGGCVVALVDSGAAIDAGAEAWRVRPSAGASVEVIEA